MLLKASEAYFFFFIISSSSSSLRSLSSALISHQALISTQHQSQSRRRRQPQPPASPSPAPSPGVAVASPNSSRRRPTPSTLTSLPHHCRPTHILAVTDPSSHLTHLPTLPSQPLLLLAAHAILAHASAHARRRRQPTSGQCSLFISS